MKKYAINKEFWPYSLIAPPMQNTKIAGFLGVMMKPPKWLWRDKEIIVKKETIESFDKNNIEVLIISPSMLNGTLPCLVYYHGGGFVFGAAGYHYELVKRYAIECCCKVVFVQYRLAPKNPHPVPVEDCYSALRWIYENSQSLNIDESRVGVAGDSAGGALAAAVCQMARDRSTTIPLFQLLIYPVTDCKMMTDSCMKYKDTPMWNSKLTKKMWEAYIKDFSTDITYASPMHISNFENLPQAYIETAEFDCLHDEAILYASALKKAGVLIQLNETIGTMHGFDIVKKAPTTMDAVCKRINYIKEKFKD